MVNQISGDPPTWNVSNRIIYILKKKIEKILGVKGDMEKLLEKYQEGYKDQ